MENLNVIPLPGEAASKSRTNGLAKGPCERAERAEGEGVLGVLGGLRLG